ncbi:MAG: hypothetical protein ABJG15_05335 [Hyphomonadaceae bacterium]
MADTEEGSVFDYERVIKAWDSAEVAIKQAENVCLDVVIPAVAELRYAGRRFIEAQVLASNGDIKGASAKFEDAYFFCCRAQHDAVDAATAKITKDYSICVKGIGASEKAIAFPENNEFRDLLRKVQKLVVSSREDRDKRDQFYEMVRETDFPKILSLYDKFQDCQPGLEELARKSRRAWLKPMLVTFTLTQIANTLWHVYG